MARKRTMRLDPEDDSLLASLYVQFSVPTDQFDRRPGESTAFIRRWNDWSGRRDCFEDVLHYMVTQRKSKKARQMSDKPPWPTLDGKYDRPPQGLELTDEELTALREIYMDEVVARRIAIDVLKFDVELKKLISTEFRKRVGRHIPGAILVAEMVDKRKRGLWPTLRDSAPPPPAKEQDGDIGFGDIDDVG